MKPNGYPQWVCDTCGQSYGKWYTKGHYTGPAHWCATYHIGNCEICLAENVSVTEPRDFGGLKRPLTYMKSKPEK
jgi:hypothetical protein